MKPSLPLLAALAASGCEHSSASTEQVIMSDFEGCVGFVRDATIDQIPRAEVSAKFEWIEPSDSPLVHPLRGTVDIDIVIEPEPDGLRFVESEQCRMQSCPVGCVSRHETQARITIRSSDGMFDEEFRHPVGLTHRDTLFYDIEVGQLESIDGELAEIDFTAEEPWQVHGFAIQLERNSNGIAVGRLLSRLMDDEGLLGMTAVGILSPQ